MEKAKKILKKHMQNVGKNVVGLHETELYECAINAINEALAISRVSKSIAKDYAEFCVRCDRERLPLLCLEDYIKQYCC